MRFFAVAFGLFLCALLSEGVFARWRSCGAKGDHGKIIHFSVVPAVPHPGAQFHVFLTMRLDKTVTGGVLQFTATVSGLQVLDVKYDLCKVSSSMPCPMQKGVYGPIRITELMPRTVPKGKYSGVIRVTDQDDEPVVCLALSVEIRTWWDEAALDNKLIQYVNSHQNAADGSRDATNASRTSR